MSSAALLMSLVAACVKGLSPEITLAEKIAARSALSVLVALALIARGSATWRPGNPRLLLLRSLFGAAAMMCYFSALEQLPVGEVVTLNLLSPFWVILFAAAALRERIRGLQVVAVLVAFAGMVAILQPGRVPLSRASMLAVLSAVLSGAAYTCLRALRTSDRPETVALWFSVILLVIFLPSALARGSMPAPRDGLLLLGIGIFGALGQILMTAAYRHAPGGEASVYSYLRVVFALLLQIIFWFSLPRPGAILGAGLVMAGGWLNFRSARKKPGSLLATGVS